MAHYKGPSAPMGRVRLQTVWWGGQCRADREEDKEEEQKKGRLVGAWMDWREGFPLPFLESVI